MKKKKQKKFWRAKTMFGHVGVGKYYSIYVPCVAYTKEEAMSKVSNNVGGVKHSNLESIIRIQEIDKASYLKTKDEYSTDPYIIAKRNCTKRSELRDLIKDSIKRLPRNSHQSIKCRESRKDYKQQIYHAAISRAKDDIRAYLY